MKTWPEESRVAVWDRRAEAMDSAEDQELVAGSYNSVEVRELLPLEPPATSTLPGESRVAVWPARAEAMEPAEDQELVAGSYTSVEARVTGLPRAPPETRTLPEESR